MPSAVLLDNLRVLGQVAPHGRLRFSPIDPAATGADGISPDTHRLVLEDRIASTFRRTLSGDGRASMISFLKHVLERVGEVANLAIEDDRATDNESHNGEDVFHRSPREELMQVCDALTDAHRGLQRMLVTTYSSDKQSCVELTSLMSTVAHMKARVSGYLSCNDPRGLRILLNNSTSSPPTQGHNAAVSLRMGP